MIKYILANVALLALAVFVYFIPPESVVSITVFFVLLFLFLFGAISSFHKSPKPALVVSFAVVSFLILRSLGAGNLLNLGLIAGIAISILLV